ncbi:MAG: hypothetical protein ACKVUS_04035 [Saprospiraceae bacterium]
MTCILPLVACKEKIPDPITETPIYWGEASVVLNGTPNALRSAALIYDGKINLHLEFQIIPNYRRYGIGISKLPQETGIYYPVIHTIDEEEPNFLFDWPSGDAVLAFYDLMQDSSLIVEIKEFDPATKDISGTYSGEFVKNTPELINGSPDTVRMEHGIFKTKISGQ